MVKIPNDKVLDCFCYKIDTNVVYKEDGSMVTDQTGFYKKYDVNSIDLPPNRNCSRRIVVEYHLIGTVELKSWAPTRQRFLTNKFSRQLIMKHCRRCCQVCLLVIIADFLRPFTLSPAN